MANACLIPIKAVPNAPRSEIVGWHGGALKIRIHAPPVEGRANEAICSFVAECLGIPKRAVSIARGNTSRLKQLRIEGLLEQDVLSRLVGEDPGSRGSLRPP